MIIAAAGLRSTGGLSALDRTKTSPRGTHDAETSTSKAYGKMNMASSTVGHPSRIASRVASGAQDPFIDPNEDMAGILMTQRAWTSPSPPEVCLDFWTSAWQAIDDQSRGMRRSAAEA